MFWNSPRNNLPFVMRFAECILSGKERYCASSSAEKSRPFSFALCIIQLNVISESWHLDSRPPRPNELPETTLAPPEHHSAGNYRPDSSTEWA